MCISYAQASLSIIFNVLQKLFYINHVSEKTFFPDAELQKQREEDERIRKEQEAEEERKRQEQEAEEERLRKEKEEEEDRKRKAEEEEEEKRRQKEAGNHIYFSFNYNTVFN